MALEKSFVVVNGVLYFSRRLPLPIVRCGVPPLSSEGQTPVPMQALTLTAYGVFVANGKIAYFGDFLLFYCVSAHGAPFYALSLGGGMISNDQQSYLSKRVV